MLGVFGIFFTFLILFDCSLAGPDDIYLEDGGYKGILIAIDENVEYDPTLIPNLKVW